MQQYANELKAHCQEVIVATLKIQNDKHQVKNAKKNRGNME